MTTLADNYKTEDCYDIKDLASEMNVKVQQANHILDRALSNKLVPKLIKIVGKKRYFAPPMAEAIIKLRSEGKLGDVRNKSEALKIKNAKLVIEVPVFDTEIAELLKAGFSSSQEMVSLLQDHLEGLVKPLLADKKREELELNKRFQEKLAKITGVRRK